VKRRSTIPAPLVPDRLARARIDLRRSVTGPTVVIRQQYDSVCRSQEAIPCALWSPRRTTSQWCWPWAT